MKFKMSGKTVTSESIDKELKADLVPDGDELQCVIGDAEFVPEATYNDRIAHAHIKVEFIVSEKGAYQRKAAFKKYAVNGDRRKAGLEGLSILDHILGNPLQNNGGDIDNSKYLSKCLVGGKVTAEFKVWEFNGKVGNFIGDVSTPSTHDAEIMKQAETAQPTSTFDASATTFNPDVDVADEFDEDMPF
jgi:hypothetical protein